MVSTGTMVTLRTKAAYGFNRSVVQRKPVETG